MLIVKPTSLPSRKTGRMTLMSNRWPVPIHGSLVHDDVAGLERLGREALRACAAMVGGAVPVNDGTL